VQQEDILKEIKKHSFYMKPGEKAAKKRFSLKRLRNKPSARSGLTPLLARLSADFRNQAQ